MCTPQPARRSSPARLIQDRIRADQPGGSLDLQQVHGAQGVSALGQAGVQDVLDGQLPRLGQLFGVAHFIADRCIRRAAAPSADNSSETGATGSVAEYPAAQRRRCVVL